MPVRFFDHNVASMLRHKRQLSAFLEKVMQQHRPFKELQIEYIFCRDEYLLGINNQFLSHDTYTDVITFDLSNSIDLPVAEIYISIERVRDNAGSYGVSYLQELYRVILHGVLHLCGFTDKTQEDRESMRQLETKYLEEYSINYGNH